MLALEFEDQRNNDPAWDGNGFAASRNKSPFFVLLYGGIIEDAVTAAHSLFNKVRFAAWKDLNLEFDGAL